MLSQADKDSIQQAKERGLLVVLVTGVFDLLHQEHKNFLKKAKAAGDFLVVGIESDVRVRQIKGAGRPINPQAVRQQQIVELGVADVVFVLPDNFSKPEDHRGLLQLIRPDILAVSSHTAHQLEKEKLMAEIGGKLLVVHQHNPLISTTVLLQKLPSAEVT